jgi:hypothetical protein
MAKRPNRLIVLVSLLVACIVYFSVFSPDPTIPKPVVTYVIVPAT